MDDISTVSTVVAAISVVIGVVFAVLEIRHMTRTRRTEVIMKIYERFGSREMLEAIFRAQRATFKNFDDYVKKYGLTDVVQIALLFEELGVLLEQNLIDNNLVVSLFGASLNSTWELLRPVIYGMRESYKQPLFFSHFEYLYKRARVPGEPRARK